MRFSMAKYHRAEFEKLDAEGRIRREGGLRIFSEPYEGRPGFHLVMIWWGKRSKADYDYLVPSDRVDAVIAAKVDNAKKEDAANKEWKERRKAVAEENYSKYRVGTLLSGSWGYDQTNCELYEIVERPTLTTAMIREVATEVVEGSEGFMCCSLRPVPGDFVGEPIKKKITSNGIKLHDCCSLSPTEAGEKHYSSWYA